LPIGDGNLRAGRVTHQTAPKQRRDKMSMMKAALLGAMIPLALATPILAQGHGERGARAERGPQMVFADLDLNGDGSVTLEEITAHRDGRFGTADADANGALSRDELLAQGADRMARGVDRMLERADANGDGELTQDEFAAVRSDRRGPNPERMFDRFDADGDGQVTEAEFDAAVAQFMERRGGRHGEGRNRG
jgi:Ca2+-binding EF-hand superfamily protein